MLKLSAAVQEKERAFDKKLERIYFLHPHLAMFLACLAAPILVLAAVILSTLIVALPIGLLLGWL